MRARTLKVVLVGATLAGAGYAAAASPKDVVAARVQNMKQIARANKAIGDELKKSQPSLLVIRSNARTLATLGPRIPGWFPRGSGPQPGVQTAALPTIWTQAPKYSRSAAQFTTAARLTEAAAARGNLELARKAAVGLGQSCKSCHDGFKAKKD